MRTAPWIVALLTCTTLTSAAASDVVFENARLRAVLSEEAAWRSLIDKASGEEYCPMDQPVSLAMVRVDGKYRTANRASLASGRLTVAFAGCDTRLVYEIDTAEDWIGFRLTEVGGARPDRVTLVRIGVTITDRVGRRMNSAWNDSCAVCLMGTSRQADCRPTPRTGYTELVATTQDAPGPKLEGSGAALVVAPVEQLRSILGRLAAAYDLPRNEQDGVPSKDLPIARQSYWFLSFTENEVDRVIEYCRKSGFRQVMLNSGAWCTSPGHYTSNFHAVAMSKFTKRPLIHSGGGFTHNLWHSFTRSATIDQYPGTYLAYINAGGKIQDWPTCKDHIDRSARRVLDCHDDMTPGELGWFGIGPRNGNYDGLQFDEIEYLMCKSLGLNAPISLQTSFARMESHSLTEDILEIVRRYEQIRLAGTLPKATLIELRRQGKDFVMLPAAMVSARTGRPEFVEVEEIREVAGTHDVRSFVGFHGDETVATIWHYLGRDGRLLIDTTEVTAYDVVGEPVALETSDGLTAVGLGPQRMTLHFSGLPVDAVRKLLADARLELRRPDVFWIRAGDFSDRVGTMVRGSDVDLDEPDALGDVVLSSGPIDRSGKTPSYCEYRVEIPRKGNWTVWARVRYPKGGDMSFGIVRPHEEVTLTGPQVIGNCGVNEAQWHWTGRGGGVTTVPPGSPVVFTLEPGRFVFRIYPREGSGTAATNPRIDCLAISEDPGYVPTDADARTGLPAQPK